MRNRIDGYMTEIPCPKCKGNRLKDEVLAVRVGGLNIAELTHLSISKAIEFIDDLKLDEKKRLIGYQVLKEVKERLSFFRDVGLIIYLYPEMQEPYLGRISKD